MSHKENTWNCSNHYICAWKFSYRVTDIGFRFSSSGCVLAFVCTYSSRKVDRVYAAGSKNSRYEILNSGLFCWKYTLDVGEIEVDTPFSSSRWIFSVRRHRGARTPFTMVLFNPKSSLDRRVRRVIVTKWTEGFSSSNLRLSQAYHYLFNNDAQTQSSWMRCGLPLRVHVRFLPSSVHNQGPNAEEFPSSATRLLANQYRDLHLLKLLSVHEWWETVIPGGRYSVPFLEYSMINSTYQVSCLLVKLYSDCWNHRGTLYWETKHDNLNICLTSAIVSQFFELKD